VNEKDAAAILDNSIQMLEIHKGDLAGFIKRLDESCPGYWEKWCEIECRALRVARDTMQS
jgi:hypothetical protein